MAEDDIGTRVDRLEQLAVVLAQSQIATNEEFKKTEEQFRETDRRILKLQEEADVRSRRVDERIDNLVSSIGELISRIPPSALSPKP